MKKVTILNVALVGLVIMAPAIGLAADDQKPAFDALRDVFISSAMGTAQVAEMTDAELATIEGQQTQSTLSFGDSTVVVVQNNVYGNNSVVIRGYVNGMQVDYSLPADLFFGSAAGAALFGSAFLHAINGHVFDAANAGVAGTLIGTQIQRP